MLGYIFEQSNFVLLQRRNSMKRNLLVVVLNLLGVMYIHNIKSTDYQYNNSNMQIDKGELVNTANSAGHLLRLLENEFKKPEYIQDILPNDFSHLIQLLEHGHKTNKPIAYVNTILNPFANMLKGAEYVNAHALVTLLKLLPDLLHHYFIPQQARKVLTDTTLLAGEMYERFSQTTNSMMYTKFASDFEFFKQDPETFLRDLSGQIGNAAQEEVQIEKLRHATIRFLDTCLSKLIWSPEDGHETWNSVKLISETLAELIESNVIEDPNDLDDLYWTLVHRYAFFLDLAGPQMHPESYQQVKQDIAHQNLLLFDLEEQDSWIETKAMYLSRVLFKAEAKSRGIEQGIIVS